MTQLKDLSTAQIKGDTGNWFAVHYVGAFSSFKDSDTYLGRQASFLTEFGGPAGISIDEYAAVPYPKSAKKLNDSISTGSTSNLGGNYPKIGMVLNGTVTSIFSDDVHSDTFNAIKKGSGIGGKFDPEEGFVRYPGGEQTYNVRRDAAEKFKQYDKHIITDLEKAEEDIANAAVYPGSRGYYECFIDDWYVEGIVCDWDNFERYFGSRNFQGPQALSALFSFMKVIKDKKIKIYDKNFETKMFGYNDLCDMFSGILDRTGVMEYKENPDGSITGALDGFKHSVGNRLK